MKIGTEGLNLIKRFEGLRLTPYLCPAGYWTIGYGHLITYEEDLPEEYNHYQFTESDADIQLELDVEKFSNGVSRLTSITLTQNQFDALVSFSFNLGLGAYQRSTLRQKLNRGEYDTAAREFSKWVYAGGRRVSGLIRRRAAEQALFEKPDVHRYR